jgi:hypothetical protein
MSAQLLAGEPQSPASPPETRAPSANRASRVKLAGACGLVSVVLFVVYIRLSWTAPVNSDGAANVLQAHDMLNGNVLLHGWWLSDVSFYSTELPQYVLLEALLGAVPAVIHVASAMTYTIVIVLAAVLAKGRSTGREAVIRMLLVVGIMLAPQPGGPPQDGGGVFVLDLSLGHIGTAVPMLITWLLIDRAGTRRWVPAAVGLLLAWALVADSLVLVVGILPVVTCCAVRLYRARVIRREPLTTAWFEMFLAAAAVAAVPVAATVLAVMRALGGFQLEPANTLIIQATGLPGHVETTFESVLVLFGADFLGLPAGLPALCAFLHLVGVALAGWAVWIGIRRLVRGSGQGSSHSLVDDVMVVAILANLAGYLITMSVRPSYARDIAVVLPFAAALAGRLLPTRLTAMRLFPALGVALAGYAFTLAFGVVQPAVPTQNSQLAQWLASRHLHYGLGPYWQASSATVASDERVQVNPVADIAGRLVGTYPWEAVRSWYDPRLHDANFLVLDGQDRYYPASLPYVTRTNAVATFGKPAETFRVGQYTILVWHKNLLVSLHCTVFTPKPDVPSAAGPAPCE